MHTGAFGNVDNQLDVCVVVAVRAARHFDVVVCHPNVLCIHAKVFRRGHHGELDGAIVAKRLIRPFAHRTDLFHGCNTVIANEDFRDDTVTTVRAHKFSHHARRGVAERGPTIKMLIDFWKLGHFHRKGTSWGCWV